MELSLALRGLSCNPLQPGSFGGDLEDLAWC